MISRDLTEHVLASEALREAQVALSHVTRVTTLGEVTASSPPSSTTPMPVSAYCRAGPTLSLSTRVPAAEEATSESRLQQLSPA